MLRNCVDDLRGQSENSAAICQRHLGRGAIAHRTQEAAQFRPQRFLLLNCRPTCVSGTPWSHRRKTSQDPWDTHTRNFRKLKQ